MATAKLCAEACGTDHGDAVRIALDEVLTALEECLAGLTDEQVWAFPLPGRHCIASIVMHCQENLDVYACLCQTGVACLEHDPRFDLWRWPEDQVPGPMPDMPGAAMLVERAKAIRAAAMPGIEAATSGELAGRRHCPDWWVARGKNAADAYLRTIHHTQAHVRQIWLMRGAMGLTDTDGWAEQHWA